MDKFMLIIHIILSICIIIITLIQKGKGSEAGVVGGSMSDNLFGGYGSSTFLSRCTFFLLFLFIMSSLILNKEISFNKKNINFNIDSYIKKIDYENIN
ncbi:MAG: preprotein translocase subunit SecG [Candidatus Azosocius agrarius]|nr:MAG: preprotein translocase subunit SecG [Gammaproteobacteria bacterium]